MCINKCRASFAKSLVAKWCPQQATKLVCVASSVVFSPCWVAILLDGFHYTSDKVWPLIRFVTNCVTLLAGVRRKEFCLAVMAIRKITSSNVVHGTNKLHPLEWSLIWRLKQHKLVQYNLVTYGHVAQDLAKLARHLSIHVTRGEKE